MSDDQDFFFDEDEEQIEEAPADKPERKASSGAKKPAPRQSAAGYGGSSVSMTVAALIGVVALLAGIIIGILIPAGGSVPAPTATGTSSTAPELTQEQLESGQMPEGHPDITGMGMPTTEVTATTEATTTE